MICRSANKYHLCPCITTTATCRCVTSSAARFERTCDQIQVALSHLELKKNQKLHKNKIKDKKPMEFKRKKLDIEDNNYREENNKCRKISCMENTNEDLIRQNMRLNEYFHIFQTKYKSNKEQVQQMRRQNQHLKEALGFNNRCQKQKQKNYQSSNFQQQERPGGYHYNNRSYLQSQQQYIEEGLGFGKTISNMKSCFQKKSKLQPKSSNFCSQNWDYTDRNYRQIPSAMRYVKD